MVKLTVMYGHPQDAGAFERYYAETHLPIASRMTGLERIELSKVVGTPDGSKPAYYRMADLYFSSMQQMQTVMASPEAQAAVGDLPNFATGGVTLVVSEVG